MERIMTYVKKNLIVELCIVVVLVFTVVLPKFFSDTTTFDYIENLVFEKTDDDADEYVVIVGQFKHHSSTRKQKNWVYQIAENGTLIKKYEQNRRDDTFGDGYLLQNQYDGNIYINMVGTNMPNYLWRYDDTSNRLSKTIFPFADNTIGIAAFGHYGDDALVVTHGSHLMHEQNEEGDGTLQSICSYKMQICQELDGTTYSNEYAASEYANKRMLVTRYKLDKDGNYLIQLNLLNEHFQPLRVQNIDTQRKDGVYGKEFVLHDQVYLLSEHLENKYAYRIDDSLTIKELNVSVSDGLASDVYLNQNNIIHVKDNEFVTVGTSSTGEYLLSITVEADEIKVKKVGESFPSGSNIVLSHKATKDNLIYTFASSKTKEPASNQIFLYDGTTLELVKTIPLDAIDPDDVITLVDRIK